MKTPNYDAMIETLNTMEELYRSAIETRETGSAPSTEVRELIRDYAVICGNLTTVHEFADFLKPKIAEESTVEIKDGAMTGTQCPQPDCTTLLVKTRQGLWCGNCQVVATLV